MVLNIRHSILSAPFVPPPTVGLAVPPPTAGVLPGVTRTNWTGSNRLTGVGATYSNLNFNFGVDSIYIIDNNITLSNCLIQSRVLSGGVLTGPRFAVDNQTGATGWTMDHCTVNGVGENNSSILCDGTGWKVTNCELLSYENGIVVAGGGLVEGCYIHKLGPLYDASLGAWTLNSATTAPPASGQIRLNNASQNLATRMYIHKTNADGVSADTTLKAIIAEDGFRLLDPNNAATWQNYGVLAAPTDGGTYYDYQVAWQAGTPVPVARVTFGWARVGGAHVDGIQCGLMNGITVRGNWVESFDTSDMIMGQEFGTSNNITLTGNTLINSDGKPTSYAIYAVANNVSITNNRIQRGSAGNGYLYENRLPGLVWSGNVDYVTGLTIPLPPSS